MQMETLIHEPWETFSQACAPFPRPGALWQLRGRGTLWARAGVTLPFLEQMSGRAVAQFLHPSGGLRVPREWLGM